jgi:hypothetical protein
MCVDDELYLLIHRDNLSLDVEGMLRLCNDIGSC